MCFPALLKLFFRGQFSQSELTSRISTFSPLDSTLLEEKLNHKQNRPGVGNKRNRRSLKRNKNKAKEQKLTFVGVNCAGLNSKLNSLDSLISQLNASVIFLQETKHRKQGKIGAANLKNYQVYQLIRKNSQGGGMAIAAHKDLNPIWLGEGNDETEVLSVQI